MATQFQDDDVNAVAGNIKIWNRCNTITKCLGLELILNVNLLRPAFSLVGAILIVPGALGAFRKKVMLRRGKYDKDVLTEDFDLTMKVLKSGGMTVASQSLCYSRVPTTLMGFYKQRTRWMRGNFQTMMKHRNILSNSSYNFQKYAYSIMLVSFFLYPTMNMMVGGFAIYAIWKGYIFPIIIPFAVFMLLQFLVGIMAIVMDRQEKDWKIILYSPLFVVGYRHILDLIILESIFDVLVRKNLKWTSISHKGSADTTSQIVLTFMTAPIKVIDKIFSTRLEYALITNPKRGKYSLVLFCMLFAITVGAGITTAIKFVELGQIHYLLAPGSVLNDDATLYDKSFISVMTNISHLTPSNETLLVSSNAAQVGYFAGHANNVMDTSGNGIFSKEALLDFMTKRNIKYLMAFETEVGELFTPSGLESLKNDFEKMATYNTHNYRVHLYYYPNWNQTLP